LDREDQRHTKQDPYILGGGATLRFPEKVVGRSDSPLPDYETSEARHNPVLKKPPPKKVDPRLLRAILYAFAIYVLLSVVIGVPIIVLKRNKSSTTRPPDPSIWGNGDTDLGAPQNLLNAGNWTLGQDAQCEWDHIHDDPTHFSYAANSQHSFTPSGSFFVRSNISLTTDNSGFIETNLSVDMNPDSTATKVVFQVNLIASTSMLLRSTGVCFNDTGTDRGLFIYVAQKLTSMDTMWLEIRLLFPQNSSHQIVDNFITYLPGFTQTFGNLTGTTSFNNIIIEGASRDINCDYMRASKISVKNSYASIRGDFRVSDTLNLDGIKGSIITNVTLASDPTRQSPTFLTLDTGDGDIDARVTLLAPTSWFVKKPDHPRAFVADVKTFNGLLNLKVGNSISTPPVPLQLSVQTNLANTSVTLDANYEGLFTAQTKLSQIKVQEGDISPGLDPLRKNRHRNITYSQKSPTLVRGWTGWGQQPRPDSGAVQGQVKIISSLSPVVLQLCGS